MNARRRKVVNSTVSNFSNTRQTIEYEPFTITLCTVQPFKSTNLVDDSGYRDREMYIVYTKDVVQMVTEGSATGYLADQVEITINGNTDWFTVLTTNDWRVGLIPHQEITLVREVKK